MSDILIAGSGFAAVWTAGAAARRQHEVGLRSIMLGAPYHVTESRRRRRVGG